MALPKKIREWWNYLKSLNEYQEHGKILMLEGDVSTGVPLEVIRKVSSGDDYFAYGLMGFIEWTPIPVLAGEVMDPDVNTKDHLTLQVSLDVPEVNLFGSPITFSQLCGPEMSSFEPIEFGHILRLVHDATIKAVFTPRATFPPQSTRRVGVAFVGCWASQNALDYAFRKGYEEEARIRRRRDKRATGSPITMQEVEP